MRSHHSGGFFPACIIILSHFIFLSVSIRKQVKSQINLLIYIPCCSVKHEYDGKWDDKKTRLTTCDPHAKRAVSSSNSPQEVADKQEVIFTYDVEFQVMSFFLHTTLSLVTFGNVCFGF